MEFLPIYHINDVFHSFQISTVFPNSPCSRREQAYFCKAKEETYKSVQWIQHTLPRPYPGTSRSISQRKCTRHSWHWSVFQRLQSKRSEKLFLERSLCIKPTSRDRGRFSRTQQYINSMILEPLHEEVITRSEERENTFRKVTPTRSFSVRWMKAQFKVVVERVSLPFQAIRFDPLLRELVGSEERIGISNIWRALWLD